MLPKARRAPCPLGMLPNSGLNCIGLGPGVRSSLSSQFPDASGEAREPYSSVMPEALEPLLYQSRPAPRRHASKSFLDSSAPLSRLPLFHPICFFAKISSSLTPRITNHFFLTSVSFWFLSCPSHLPLGAFSMQLMILKHDCFMAV